MSQSSYLENLIAKIEADVEQMQQLQKNLYQQELQKISDTLKADEGSLVEKELISEREIGRRELRSWVSGNTKYTEIEITNEQTFRKKGLNQKGMEMMSKAMEKIQSILAPIKKIIQSSIENLQNYAKEHPQFTEFAVNFIIYLALKGKGLKMPLSRPKLPLKGTTQPAIKTEIKPSTPVTNPPQNKVIQGSVNPKDRIEPKNLPEQIHRNNLETMVKNGQFKEISKGENIRDVPRLQSQHGGKAEDWSKISSTMKSEVTKETKSQIHAYLKKPTGEIVNPKFKDYPTKK